MNNNDSTRTSLSKNSFKNYDSLSQTLTHLLFVFMSYLFLDSYDEKQQPPYPSGPAYPPVGGPGYPPVGGPGYPPAPNASYNNPGYPPQPQGFPAYPPPQQGYPGAPQQPTVGFVNPMPQPGFPPQDPSYGGYQQPGYPPPGGYQQPGPVYPQVIIISSYFLNNS